MWRDGQWRWGEGSAHLMNSHWRLFMLWRVKKKYYIRGGNRSVVTVQAAANGIDQVEEMKMKDTIITQWTPSTPVSLLLEQKHMIINYSHISFPSRMTKQAVTTLKSVANSVTFIYFRTFFYFCRYPRTSYRQTERKKRPKSPLRQETEQRASVNRAEVHEVQSPKIQSDGDRGGKQRLIHESWFTNETRVDRRRTGNRQREEVESETSAGELHNQTCDTYKSVSVHPGCWRSRPDEDEQRRRCFLSTCCMN